MFFATLLLLSKFIRKRNESIFPYLCLSYGQKFCPSPVKPFVSIKGSNHPKHNYLSCCRAEKRSELLDICIYGEFMLSVNSFITAHMSDVPTHCKIILFHQRILTTEMVGGHVLVRLVPLVSSCLFTLREKPW